VGIEALSRGAVGVTLVEQGAAALAVLRGNLEKLGVGAGVVVERRSVGSFLKRAKGRFGVVFLDPPYEAVEEYALALGLLGGECAGLLEAGAMVVAEHRRKRPLEASYGKLVRVRVKEQGDAGLSFYEVGLAGCPDVELDKSTGLRK
jgi:16S rRNA G966 N2-methylase RsmD